MQLSKSKSATNLQQVYKIINWEHDIQHININTQIYDSILLNKYPKYKQLVDQLNDYNKEIKQTYKNNKAIINGAYKKAYYSTIASMLLKIVYQKNQCLRQTTLEKVYQWAKHHKCSDSQQAKKNNNKQQNNTIKEDKKSQTLIRPKSSLLFHKTPYGKYQIRPITALQKNNRPFSPQTFQTTQQLTNQISQTIIRQSIYQQKLKPSLFSMVQKFDYEKNYRTLHPQYKIPCQRLQFYRYHSPFSMFFKGKDKKDKGVKKPKMIWSVSKVKKPHILQLEMKQQIQKQNELKQNILQVKQQKPPAFMQLFPPDSSRSEHSYEPVPKYYQPGYKLFKQEVQIKQKEVEFLKMQQNQMINNNMNVNKYRQDKQFVNKKQEYTNNKCKMEQQINFKVESLLRQPFDQFQLYTQKVKKNLEQKFQKPLIYDFSEKQPKKLKQQNLWIEDMREFQKQIEKNKLSAEINRNIKTIKCNNLLLAQQKIGQKQNTKLTMASKSFNMRPFTAILINNHKNQERKKQLRQIDSIKNRLYKKDIYMDIDMLQNSLLICKQFEKAQLKDLPDKKESLLSNPFMKKKKKKKRILKKKL